MRLIKMTGGLGNQMFIYVLYLRMKSRFPDTRIDLSDMQHYHVHYGIHDSHDPAHKQVSVGKLGVRHVELTFLIRFCVVSAHHAHAGKILSRHVVEVIGERLYPLESGYGEKHYHEYGEQQ